jgi:N-methylhydantoinase B
MGGGPGGPAGITLNPGTADERRWPSKTFGIRVKRGDVLRLQGAGGAGWGNPAEREPELIEADEAEGFA